MKKTKKLFYKRIFNILLILSLIFSNLISSVPVFADESSLKTDDKGQYIISTVEELNDFRKAVNTETFQGKTVILTKDIDVGDFKLEQTTGTFQGTFNGQGYKISGFNDIYSGLFYDIGASGYVANLHINMNVADAVGTYNSSYSAMLYGSIADICSRGKISLCTVDGIMKFSSSTQQHMLTGGIVGWVKSSKKLDARIENCCSRADIVAPSDKEIEVCGLADGAIYDQTINNCYVSGNLQGKYVYAITNTNTTSFPYSNSYYDGEKIHPTTLPQAGVSKTAAEMKQQNTYSGWDFVSVWDISKDVNDGYPYLRTDQIVQPIIDMPVDVNINIKDKTVNKDGTADLKADYTCDITNLDAKMIKDYGVQVKLPVDLFFPSSTGKNLTMLYDRISRTSTIDSNTLKSKLQLTYNTDKKEYKFKLGNVTFNTPNFYDNEVTKVYGDGEKAAEIEKAKEAENIMYDKLPDIMKGSEGYDKFSWTTVPKFSWVGARASSKGEEGTMQFTSPLWEVYSSARSGYKGMKDGYYDEWFKSVQDGLKEMKKEGIEPLGFKMTEWEKLVLAITAAGYDARDIEAYDLIDIVSNEEYLSKSKQFFTPQYAVFALNSYKYPIPKEGNRINIESKIHTWAESAKDGVKTNPNRATDMNVMSYQPIADYYKADAKPGDKYYDVKEAMDAVFEQYSNAQTYESFFWGGYYDSNAWNNAQVYMTLGMTKHDIFDSKFIKNGNDIFKGALSYYDFKNKTMAGGLGGFSYDPCQLSRGLDSLVRSYEGRNSIFDCTDVKDSTVLVNNAVAALPDSITSANKKEVEDAQKLYDALTVAKKASIKASTKAKLDAAQKALNNPAPDVTAAAVAAGITSVTAPLKNVTNLVLPVVPAGYTIAIKSSDKPEVIGLDGKITPPDKDTAVALVFTVTNTADKTTADTASINVTVAAKDDTGIDKTIEISNLTQEKQFNLGNDAQITIQAANKGSEAKNVSLIVGIYDNNGALVSYGASEQNINASSSVKLRVTLKLPDKGNYTVKGFVWNGLEEMTPISYPIEIPTSNK
ncbi:cell surface protein [Clostridium sp. P21]|uniref:Cell surface protein n=1 Tax=Clostridium muellerianum TaxID=2716538 RepID=A0A7Y0HQ97_9CLOT|nr:cell surface protein [Clostridium muellerianum]NMM63543.1 cell surface protein [Clostridium muellerianum]